jgi:hypothetical protein
MFKKFLTALVAVCMIAAFTVTASAMSIDLAAEFEAMMNEEGTYLQMAGSPDFAFDGGIKVSGRTADWNAVDFIFNNLEAGVAYTLTVSFSSPGADGFLIAEADSPWGWLVNTDGTSTDTLSLSFTLDSSLLLDGQNRIRLMPSNQTTGDYTITAITLTGGSAAATTPAVTEAPAAGNDTPATAGDTTVTPPGDKDGVDTGIAGIATVIGVAVAATAGVAVSVKKKK